MFIVAVAAEPKVDSIVPEQLAQVGEDRTCTNVDIKFRLPQGGYYTVDMTQETIDKIKADAKSGDEMDELTMTSVKQTVKQGATTEAAAKAVAMTGSNIDMKMDGPIAETQTTAKEVVMVPARVTRQDWPIMPKTAIHNFYDQVPHLLMNYPEKMVTIWCIPLTMCMPFFIMHSDALWLLTSRRRAWPNIMLAAISGFDRLLWRPDRQESRFP